MRSKKVLTLLLVLCMMFNMIAPAGAIVANPESRPADMQTQKENNTSSSDKNGLVTLRDTEDYVVGNVAQGDKETAANGGSWNAELITSGSSGNFFNGELPAYVQELQEAIENHKAGERVTAFVVLEKEALASTYSSIRNVPQSELAQMEKAQDNLIAAMEKVINLEVVETFTYLTNAIVIETEVENLMKIAGIEGVKSVFVSPVFYACETEMSPYTVSSGQMSNVDDVWELPDLGYAGEGMTIAILDTGIDLDHPSFAADPEGILWTKEYVADMLAKYDLKAEQLYRGTLTAGKLYFSAKLPFIFNYASGDIDVSHDSTNGDHGSHVAGISAANKVDGVGVVGMAPNAQIIVMKVFGAGGGASMLDCVRALEDCMTMGVNVANLSLGSPAGFSESGWEEWDQIYRNIANTDLLVDIAAGNEGTSAYGSLYGTYLNTTENVDTSSISSPSTYANALSVGSVDNIAVPTSFFTLADGTQVFFQDSREYLYGYIDYNLNDLAGDALEYVIVPGLGAEEDFYDADGNSIVDGKIAVIKRGTLNFGVKALNAYNAGAVAAIIWDNVSEDIFTFGMSTELEDGSYVEIPIVLVSLEDGEKMSAAETKELTASADPGFRVDATGGGMSYFSCWGVSPELRLLPDISGVGGNIYSCYDGGGYGLMSGTSMATPQVAGVSALVVQYIKDKNLDDQFSLRFLADALMMSTAVPVKDSSTKLEASPRQQGSGLVDALGAVTTTAFLSVDGGRPKAELGDSDNGKFSFTFDITNFGATDKTYTLSSSLLCEDYVEYVEYPGIYFMAEHEYNLEAHDATKQAVTFSKGTVTVPAGDTVQITVTIELSAADMTWIDTYFPNGNYVEGFVFLTDADENGVDMSLPFLGFYGDWAAAPMLDTGYWYEDSFWKIPTTEVEGNQFWHMPWVSLGSTDSDWLLGFNPYTGYLDDSGKKLHTYDPKNNVVSPNGDGLIDNISNFYLSLMRNAEELYLTYTDAEGNVLDKETLTHINKTMFKSNYGQVVPFIYNWYYNSLYDFAGLEDGAEVTLTISAILPGETEAHESVVEIPVTVDLSAPKLDSYVAGTAVYGDSTLNVMQLTVSDPHLAAVIVTNLTGTQVYGTYGEQHFVKNENGSYTVTIDVTNLGTEFAVTLADYGCNEAQYKLTWTDGDNIPEMPKDVLYGYQTYHLYYDYMGSPDLMYGWSQVYTKDGLADARMLQSDAYEYYALNAAEYAGGYIFAVDAGGNFIYMVPGLWNRNQICNLGLTALDMAFDETTNTMYLLATSGSISSAHSLYTIDLLTGELTLLATYRRATDAPQAMTFVDGKLYCTKYYYGGLYTIELEDEDTQGTLTSVTKADGTALVPATYRPQYIQSMTEVDGQIYWAMAASNYSALIVIDLETESCTATSFNYQQIFIGLLTLEGDYELPESTEVETIVLDTESATLPVGSEMTLTATALPWNAPVTGGLVWTSSNEAVATVEDGVVTAVGAGTATITVAYGDVEAECEIRVIAIQGNLNAYQYYAGGYDGVWLNIDLGTVTETTVADSPVDFIAADYNGHTKMVYGFDNVGQCYWYDPATGEYGKLGTANIGAVPYDMAYDYSTGLMFALVSNMMTGSTLYVLNMNSGELVEVASVYDYYVALACSTEGILYAISSEGILYQLELVVDEFGGGGGGGIMPWEKQPELNLQALMDPTLSYMVDPIFLMETPLSGIQYVQSMCYDHNNDALLWVNPESSLLFWIGGLPEDLDDDAIPYWFILGNPTGSLTIEYTGLYVIPEDEVEDLEETPIVSVEGGQMVLMVGDAKEPQISIKPTNATVQTVKSMEIAYSLNYDTFEEGGVVSIEDGKIVGVGEGEAYIYVYVEGFEEPALVMVNVVNPTDNMFAYLVQDVDTYASAIWIELDDADPANYSFLGYVEYKGMSLVLYSAEYVDGMVYAYGFDPDDWEANFLFLTIDPETWMITSATDMGEEFPFVYDMAFDYTTGTMYALAGPGSQSTDLYFVDLETGELTLCTATGTEYMFMGLAIDANGTMYAMAQSDSYFDEWTYTDVYAPAVLYTIDPINNEIEEYMYTNTISTGLTSMSYDYDTGYIYWHAAYVEMGSLVSSSLCLIDPENWAVYELGTVGAAGSQISGLMIIADEYPEVSDELVNIKLTSKSAEMHAGDTVELDYFIQPSGVDAVITWSSSNDKVATVDENGVVTAVAAGAAIITVTATQGEKTVSATCTVLVYGDDDFFITYNLTDGGFAVIDRMDSTIVTNITEGEDEAPVSAMAMVNGYIFAYDVENNLFITSIGDNFERRYLGNTNLVLSYNETIEEDNYGTYGYTSYYTPGYMIADMTWDEANDRMLALVLEGYNYVNYYWSGTPDNREVYDEGFVERVDGCGIYEVNMKNGELTLVGYLEGVQTVVMMEFDSTGMLYIFSCYGDYIMRCDLEAGTIEPLVTLQSIGASGSTDGHPMSMTYDPVTNRMYLTLTSNGKFYRMYQFDPVNYMVNLIDYIGEAEYYEYVNHTDAYAGLVLSEEHVCHAEDYVFAGSVAPTCTEDGYEYYHCPMCLKGEYHEIPAKGHTYDMVVGNTYTCIECGYSVNLGDDLPVTPPTPEKPDEPEVPVEPETPEIPEAPFEDLTAEWYKESVAYVFANGLMTGVSETEFAPTVEVTRAMVVQVLYRLAGAPAVSGTNDFTDLTSSWYKDAVQWAVNNGITSGRTATTFAPDAKVTREELAVFIYRFSVATGIDTSASNNLGGYADASDISTWAEDALSWANAEGLVNGRTADTLAPKGTANRAELATILMRFCENVAK